MIVTAYQDIFNTCRDLAIDLVGIDNVYDYLPPKGVKYPFIYIGMQQHVEDTWKNKDFIYPTIYQQIYIYTDDPNKRGSITRLAAEFIDRIRKSKQGDYFSYKFLNIGYTLMEDNTAEIPLLQARINIELKAY